MTCSAPIPRLDLPCCHDSFVCPLHFSHLLQAGQDQELTYITLTAHIDPQEQKLRLHLACFEKSPLPEYHFEIELGSSSHPLSLQFSSSQASLPHPGITLHRDGGENLEGIFWGVWLDIPLSLLPKQELPVRMRYLRQGTISSPFPHGEAVWNLPSKK